MRTTIMECSIWDEGDWVGWPDWCVNKRNPQPWSDESELIPKSLAFYGDVTAVNHGWLKQGQKYGYTGCASGPPIYDHGVETYNVEWITTYSKTGAQHDFFATRRRDFVCASGYKGNPKNHLCYRSSNPKEYGCPQKKRSSKAKSVGEPANATTGNEFQFETDYRGPSGTLSFTRAYNSLDVVDHGLGYGWVSNVGRHLAIEGNSLTVYAADGRGEPFTLSNGAWQGDADTKLQLTQDSSGYTVRHQDGSVDHFDTDGRLISSVDVQGRATTYTYDSNGHVTTVTGPFGHELSFSYNSDGRLATFTDPADNVTQYSYDSNGNLTQVSYPDGTAKQYSYGDRNYPHALTGVAYVDAAGNVTPYDSFTYNSDGKVVTNSLAGGQRRFDLSYDSDTQTTVTDAAGSKDILTFKTRLGVKDLLSKIKQSDGKGLTQQFDARNNLTQSTDADGHVTTYSYDEQNRLTSRTEAAGTPQARTLSYQYTSDSLALPSEITRPSVCSGASQQTDITYDGHHNPISITETGYTPNCSPVTRTLSLAYNNAGQIIRIDGPRTGVNDVTTLSYNDCQSGGACGQLKSLTDALGHTTTYDQYDANGRLLQMTGPNGLVTTYTYAPRGLVTRITQQPFSGSARTTSFAYTASGKLAQAHFPDGRTLTYTYNDAQELIQVTDNLGDKVSYSYDSRGNRTQTATYDPDGTLVSQIQQTYDLRNHLASINDGGSVTRLVSDALGNLTRQTDPNHNPPTTHGYDPLNRLIQTVNALGGVTAYSYNPNDQVTQVETPNGATTQYQYDDFGDLLAEDSPDRGTTIYAYDDAGNLISKTDARGVTATYRYDALNRLTAIRYSAVPKQTGHGVHDERYRHDGLTQLEHSPDVTLIYDSGNNCSNGIGRLCRVQDPSGTTDYAYDAYGNVLTETHVEAGRHRLNRTTTTQYRYDAGNRVIAITYPDGREVDYSRDALGRIQAIAATVNGKTRNIVTNRQYRADGLVTTQTFGNGLVGQRQYTPQGQLSQWTLTGKAANDRLYGYDANGNLVGLQDSTGMANYQYDALNRLIDEAKGRYHNAYSYDANGNRLSSLKPDGDTKAYSYAPQSNRLTRVGRKAIALDAAGNTINDGHYQYRYDAAGRLSTVLRHGRFIASYRYNYRGLRIEKRTREGITTFSYDGAGHLISEHGASDPGGNRDYVWTDSTPIAQIDGQGAIRRHSGWWSQILSGFGRHHRAGYDHLSYLHTDGLGTPRLATNARQQVVWRWTGDAFGAERTRSDHRWNPRHDRSINRIQMNLRYPGQYFDAETGLFYNWHRYYDPTTGRYGRSDPMGLRGGVDIYGYADARPTNFIDVLGLFFIFYRDAENLTWVDPMSGFATNSWHAVSGPYHKGPLPTGWYYMTGEEKPVPSEKDSMTDTCGASYKFRLHPQFKTDRSGLLIHPDGGVPGTSGCIGAKGCTKSLRDFIDKMINRPAFGRGAVGTDPIIRVLVQ
ncbi:MAG: RHS repeat-associated core domain-containing protein [Gammaproteobacteria bacterium]